ncbi:hypothetical protein [Phaeobacter sp. J2-8]|uniref:hypothetical protein n=1 Tax=Phaeobacter sp. J2-8 TaxID=2931394 RepID=UPI001FD55EE3|nr:hypothetical protein [Phaeobacter sp. J2-8]MCJ7871283.1 hypothetical protein [Phaeobacter sp. J2-8]
MSRLTLTAKYLGGLILALGLVGVGLSMPKPGWQALNERLPDWLASFENSGLVAVLGLAMIAMGKAADRGPRTKKTDLLRARVASSVPRPKVWVMEFPGTLEVFAAYCGADGGPEARNKRMQTSGKNGSGRQLAASDFPLVLQAMDDPPDRLLDYCFISGRFPMVSPRLAEMLMTLDLGNGSFFKAQFYAEDGIEELPWSHAFWNIGNRKESFLPEQSNVKRVTSGRTNTPAFELYATHGSMQEEDIAVRPEALFGPDVWIEPNLSDCIFFSDRFAQLLQEHHLLHLFEFKAVRVIVPD